MTNDQSIEAQMPPPIPDITIDERGSRCPVPVIALGRVLRKLAHEDHRSVVMELLADDPATRSDVPAWCRMQQANLIAVQELPDGTGWRFTVIVSPR
jgi:tRNA 2-thiouridine synthesizing protein A